ncbi:MAG: response regulator [Myxococcota bacterium]
MRNRVLIVDDELFFLEAIEEILTEAGYETLRAANGAEALEHAGDPSIAVVVLDVRLPDMDGISVLERIRAERPELPVIMLSASTDQEIVLEALRLGASDYLAKPLHDEELVLAVGRGIDGHEASAGRRRLQARIDRLVESMERLAQLVRWAAPAERAEVLRRGIVDAAATVFEAGRVSLMLADEDRAWLAVVACRGVDIARETLTPRKAGEGAAGRCFAESSLVCVADVARDARFAGRGVGQYRGSAFAIVPLVCLGEPVGVLCLTDARDEQGLASDEANVLRLLGMQVSEFLAADPEVERILEAASTLDAEGVSGSLSRSSLRADGDADLARAVCEAAAAEVEPGRILRKALASIARALGAAPVALYLQAPDGTSLRREAELEGSVCGDRETLRVDRGLTGIVCQSGGIVAAPAPADDARFDPTVDTAADGVARGLLCVPVKLRERVVGVLRVFYEGGARPSPRTGEVLSAAISAAVRNVLLYRSLLQSIEELAAARRAARGEGTSTR